MYPFFGSIRFEWLRKTFSLTLHFSVSLTILLYVTHCKELRLYTLKYYTQNTVLTIIWMNKVHNAGHNTYNIHISILIVSEYTKKMYSLFLINYVVNAFMQESNTYRHLTPLPPQHAYACTYIHTYVHISNNFRVLHNALTHCVCWLKRRDRGEGCLARRVILVAWAKVFNKITSCV